MHPRDFHEVYARDPEFHKIFQEVQHEAKCVRGYLFGMEVRLHAEHPKDFISLVSDEYKSLLHIGRNREPHLGSYCYGDHPGCRAKVQPVQDLLGYVQGIKKGLDYVKGPGVMDIPVNPPVPAPPRETPPSEYFHGKQKTAEQRRKEAVEFLKKSQKS